MAWVRAVETRLALLCRIVRELAVARTTAMLLCAPKKMAAATADPGVGVTMVIVAAEDAYQAVVTSAAKVVMAAMAARAAIAIVEVTYLNSDKLFRPFEQMYFDYSADSFISWPVDSELQ